ncbi:molybdopterin-guanine dinucleotide biosynthesis protein B [Ampullimonas aquatilis]|uniref:molybdopterin-guanine dinucleotide biosynthesis protein B n=1 Tax=Ampullimonas aquatilis TaxID=1341549 RepID=UPI003C709914
MKVFGIVGYSGAGKTTLIEKLLVHFRQQGIKVSIIKHSHKGFDIDRPGKDSWRHREAGACEVLIASDSRWVLMHELHNQAEPDLAELLTHFSPCDLVLVEGYKSMPIPKLEVWRYADQLETLPNAVNVALERPLRYPTDTHILALATDQAALPDPSRHVDLLDVNEEVSIASFILASAMPVEQVPVRSQSARGAA